MKVEEVLSCSFDKWYRDFEKVTIKSVILPIPEDVLRYFQENGKLVLPAECDGENYNGTEDDYDDFGDVTWDPSENTDVAEKPSFPNFSAQVRDVISQLGGSVFCKLNWSSPKDAIWVACNNSVKCSSLSDVYLLLKSSDFVAHDLTQPFKDCDEGLESPFSCVSYVLVMRKWCDINPGIEFRCFVRDKSLIAISQRDNSNFYEHIGQQRESIERDILTFFHEYVVDKFPLRNYVFDVIRPGKDRVKLLDFNPFGVTTDGLLMDWEELKEMELPDQPIFRFISHSSGVQPHPHRHYSLPQDMVDLASGTDPHKLIDFLSLKTRTESGGYDSDSD